MKNNGLVGVTTYSKGGKSTYMIELLVKSVKSGSSCGFITQEISETDLVGKMVSVYIGKNLKYNRLTEDDKIEFRKEIEELKLLFSDYRICGVCMRKLTIEKIEKVLSSKSLDTLYIDDCCGDMLDSLKELKMLSNKYNTRIFISMGLKYTSDGRRNIEDITTNDIRKMNDKSLELFDSIACIVKNKDNVFNIKDLAGLDKNVYTFKNTNLPVTFGELNKD